MDQDFARILYMSDKPTPKTKEAIHQLQQTRLYEYKKYSRAVGATEENGLFGFDFKFSVTYNRDVFEGGKNEEKAIDELCVVAKVGAVKNGLITEHYTTIRPTAKDEEHQPIYTFEVEFWEARYMMRDCHTIHKREDYTTFFEIENDLRTILEDLEKIVVDKIPSIHFRRAVWEKNEIYLRISVLGENDDLDCIMAKLRCVVHQAEVESPNLKIKTFHESHPGADEKQKYCISYCKEDGWEKEFFETEEEFMARLEKIVKTATIEH